MKNDNSKPVTTHTTFTVCIGKDMKPFITKLYLSSPADGITTFSTHEEAAKRSEEIGAIIESQPVFLKSTSRYFIEVGGDGKASVHGVTVMFSELDRYSGYFETKGEALYFANKYNMVVDMGDRVKFQEYQANIEK